MKKELNVIGLDCGHCALTLEKYLEKVEGVRSCVVNFSTSKLFLDIEDDLYKEVLKRIHKTAKQVNPDVKISEVQENDNNTGMYDIILYVIGIIVGLFVVFAKMPTWLYYTLLVSSALCMGYRSYYKAIIQMKKFKINENTLITLSLIGAVAIGESMEGLMVIALYTLGKMLESKAVRYSRKSISALISTHPEYAVVLSGDKEKRVKPEVVKVGDKIIIRAGEKVALDGVVVEGKANVDKRHLTGESAPVVVSVGDKLESGSIVLDSTIILEVESLYKDSAVSKILNLVSNASNKKSKTETIISRFSSFYTLGVIVASILVFGITWLAIGDVHSAIYRGLVFLVVSCPCAFAISVPLTYFSGIGRCSKQGILVKGSNFIDTCADLSTIIFDKTGTITTGNFVVTKVEVEGKLKKSKLLDIVVAGEKNSLHPIGKAICEYHKSKSKLEAKNYTEIVGKGIEFEIKKDKYQIGHIDSRTGKTVIGIWCKEKLIGKITLQDEIKKEAKNTINEIKSLNVKTMMLTGDSRNVATSVVKKLAIDECKAELMPEDKFHIIENLKKENNRVAFVGDGLNDAPALALSDVGISMGIMGSPATIESSDVVIADDNLNQIPNLIKISKKTKRIAWGNILFAGITKFAFLLLGSIGITGMLFAVFADVGVTLLAILNSLRVLGYKIK